MAKANPSFADIVTEIIKGTRVGKVGLFIGFGLMVIRLISPLLPSTLMEHTQFIVEIGITLILFSLVYGAYTVIVGRDKVIHELSDKPKPTIIFNPRDLNYLRTVKKVGVPTQIASVALLFDKLGTGRIRLENISPFPDGF